MLNCLVEERVNKIGSVTSLLCVPHLYLAPVCALNLYRGLVSYVRPVTIARGNDSIVLFAGRMATDCVNRHSTGFQCLKAAGPESPFP